MKRLALLFVVCACHRGSTDECAVAADRSIPLFAKRAHQAIDKDAEIADCRTQVAHDKHAAASVHCIATAANTDAATIDGCIAANSRGESQVQARLHVIVDLAQHYYDAHHAFPSGDGEPLPAFADPSVPGCCGGSDNQCAPATSSSPVWTALGFSVPTRGDYSYRYHSDGHTFAVTAVGDVDCDRDAATYELDGAIDDHGELTLTAKLPPHGTF
jgi:hypothetical protein